jgi:GTPase SAR1 family protein
VTVSDRSRSSVEILKMTEAAAKAYGRDDLVSLVDDAAERLTKAACNLVVVGEFKQGKSSLVNALLETDLCPVDDDIATAVPTFIRFGEPASALAHRLGEDPEPLNDAGLKRTVTGTSVDELVPDAVEIRMPRRLLSDGLVIVDTPGVGGLESVHGARTLAALTQADAVLFVTDSSQELTSTEAEFLKKAHRACSTIAIVLPKIDFYPEWRRIAELTTGHVSAMSITAPVFPVSSPLRREALAAKSPAINEESGFASLVQWVNQISRTSENQRMQLALATVLESVAQMTSAFVSERGALTDPNATEARIHALEDANQRVEEVRSTGGQWQTALADGITDLSSDLNLGVKEELRAVSEEGNRRIDENNPISMWDEFEVTIQKHVRDVMVENSTLLHERSDALAASIQDLFAEDEHGIDLSGAIQDDDFEATLAAAKKPDGSVAGSALTALRGSYSGILMFNMLGGMLGLTAIAPVTIGLGVVLGIKALKSERKRRLTAARQSAKQSLRKLIDEAGTQMNRYNQESVKLLRRTLRDTYADRLRILQRTTAESLAAAQKGAKTSDADRSRRVADIEAEMGRLGKLGDHAKALLAEIDS